MDVKDMEPKYRYYINRIGISGISIPVKTMLNGEEVSGIARVSAYIDLPGNQRGIHASRSYESIIEALMDRDYRYKTIDELAILIVGRLLDKHGYSRRSVINITMPTLVRVKTPYTGRDSLEKVVIYGGGRAWRDEGGVDSIKFIGVKASGLTTCPSAQRRISEIMGLDRKIPTHIQRGYGRIIIGVGGNIVIDPYKLVEIIWRSVSSPTYQLLKRDDEAKLILDSLDKPMLTEDVVREMAHLIKEELGWLPDSTLIYLEYRSIESIHDHDLTASIRMRLSDID